MSGPALAQGDSGFLRGKGNLDVALSYSLDTYDEFWVGRTKVSMPMVGRVKRHTGSVYGAYGLTDDIDLTATLSFVSAESSGGAPTEDSFQDLTAALRWRALRHEVDGGAFSLVLSPGLKTPLTSYEDDAITAIGDGQTDIRLRVTGQYLWSNGLFVALETGYDIRTDDPKDEIPLHLTVGGTIGEDLTLTAFYSKIISTGGYDIGAGPFPGVKEEYDRVGAGAYYRFTRNFGISASGWTTLRGRNTGKATGFSIGGVLSF